MNRNIDTLPSVSPIFAVVNPNLALLTGVVTIKALGAIVTDTTSPAVDIDTIDLARSDRRHSWDANEQKEGKRSSDGFTLSCYTDPTRIYNAHNR